jgi:hypothetical protein
VSQQVALPNRRLRHVALDGNARVGSATGVRTSSWWKSHRSLILLSFACAILSVLPGLAQNNKAKSTSQAKAYQRPTDPTLYVGSETGKTCHEGMPSKGFYKKYEDSPHYVTLLDTKIRSRVARTKSFPTTVI